MKHAVITGGSSGIGRAIAQRLWQRGYHLTLIARRPEMLDQTQSSLAQQPHHPTQTILTLAVDVSRSPDVNRAIQQSLNQFKAIDVLINCAGTAVPGEFLTQPVQIAEETMAVNFFGSLYASHAALSAMVERGQGHVVFISSGVGLIGLYGYTSYSPSKFAVRGLAESLRAEMKPQGVRVSIVYPPDTETPQFHRENQIKPRVTHQLSKTAQVLSADQVAQSVIQGIDSGQFIITPGLEMTVLGRLHSLINPMLNRYFDRIIAQTLSKIKNKSGAPSWVTPDQH